MSERKLSGFKPSTGMISFANVSHEPSDFPKLFIGIGKTSFAVDSSSEQHDFAHVSVFGAGVAGVLKTEFGGTGIFVSTKGAVTL